MALYTSNLYGKITITDDAVRAAVAAAALEHYGIYGLQGCTHVNSKGNKRIKKFFKKAIRVDARDNHIYIEISVILKYGMSVDAVTESLRNTIKYNIELFSGMPVEVVNINVVGIK